MGERPGQTHPVPRPRPNPDLDNWVYGPPAGRLMTWLINGAIILAGVTWAIALSLMTAVKTCGIGVQC